MLEKEIDRSFHIEDEETAQKIMAVKDRPDREKLELLASVMPEQEEGTQSVMSGMKNAFSYNASEEVEKINEQL